ncbi:MAG TPA: MerR family transcriptional regulator [Chitinophagaceae bacterium]|nr:MerR family transcriptional regulator [Chitinophagaceae bacterium]
MLIGELSKKSGFSRDTIRFYEKIGLVEVNGNARLKNNYKNYPDAVLKRLLAIKQIKEFGFTLEETRGMILLFEEGALEPTRGMRFVQRKIHLIDRKIEELQNVKSRLQQITASEEEHCPLGKILMTLN